MSMKYMIAFMGIILLLGLGACQPQSPSKEQESLFQTTVYTTDTLSFKAEYEALNAEKIPMIVPETLNIHTLTFSELQKLLEEGSGVLYFGFPSCPWCRTLLPHLFTAMEKYQLSELYYFNPKDIRDQKTLNEAGDLVIEKETSPEYAYLLEKFHDLLPEYEGLNNPEEKRLYVPFLVVLKD